MKRNGFRTRATEGTESLLDIHDYRDIDLEDFKSEADFQVFAAEILLLRLRLAGYALTDIDPDVLRDSSQLSHRRADNYTSRVLSAVKLLFPTLSQRELATEVLSDSFLRKRLSERVAKALAARGANDKLPDAFISPEFPEASITIPALLRRETLSVSEVEGEVRHLNNHEPNRFTGTTDWVHNNFVGCYLQLYDGLVRPCPFYGGFSTFCMMSRGNLRHFLELCHQALARLDGGGTEQISCVPVDMQAEAARQASADLLAEVRSFGPKGNNLHTFLLRMGSLFSLSQQRPTQSEPEVTHFSIQGEGEIGSQAVSFLAEAIKWSVLFEEQTTKKKSFTDPEGTEYVVNPIYAPYFHISYRKRRKLEITASEATTLISGSYDDVKRLLRDYQRRWSVDLAEASLPLFAHLDEENE